MSAELKATHFGVVKFDDLTCEVVVTEDGQRGYIRRQLAQMLNLADRQRGAKLGGFLAEFAPKSASALKKKGVSKVRLRSGQVADFIPAGAVGEMAMGVISAALAQKLHPKRHALLPNCQKMLSALATTGEIALIDEATGYQYRREPDALQAILARLLREDAGTWERRFQPDYYSAIYRLFGWKYAGHTKNPPHVVGAITERWVYAVVFPPEMLAEIKSRKDLSERHHQWLTTQGLNRLDGQLRAVTAVARNSTSYKDFDQRCAAAFAGGALQYGLLLEERQ